MKLLLLILISYNCYSQEWPKEPAYDSILPWGSYIIVDSVDLKNARQDSIRVKIKKIDGYKVIMKTLERPRVKLFTFCKPPFKEKDIVWIKKP